MPIAAITNLVSYNYMTAPSPRPSGFYVALKDVGVETVMVRQPREPHGIRESKHLVDRYERSIRWYEKHFPAAGDAAVSRSTGSR